MGKSFQKGSQYVCHACVNIFCRYPLKFKYIELHCFNLIIWAHVYWLSLHLLLLSLRATFHSSHCWTPHLHTGITSSLNCTMDLLLSASESLCHHFLAHLPESLSSLCHVDKARNVKESVHTAYPWSVKHRSQKTYNPLPFHG